MSKYMTYVNSTQSKQSSSCAIIINDDKGNTHKKVLAFKDCTINKAEFNGINYVINSITESNPEIEINICNTYILSMLDKDNNNEWARSPTKNVEMVAALRKLIGENNVRIVFGTGSDMEKVKWWSKMVYRLPNGLPVGAKSPVGE